MWWLAMRAGWELAWSRRTGGLAAHLHAGIQRQTQPFRQWGATPMYTSENITTLLSAFLSPYYLTYFLQIQTVTIKWKQGPNSAWPHWMLNLKKLRWESSSCFPGEQLLVWELQQGWGLPSLWNLPRGRLLTMKVLSQCSELPWRKHSINWMLLLPSKNNSNWLFSALSQIHRKQIIAGQVEKYLACLWENHTSLGYVRAVFNWRVNVF